MAVVEWPSCETIDKVRSVKAVVGEQSSKFSSESTTRKGFSVYKTDTQGSQQSETAEKLQETSVTIKGRPGGWFILAGLGIAYFGGFYLFQPWDHMHPDISWWYTTLLIVGLAICVFGLFRFFSSAAMDRERVQIAELDEALDRANAAWYCTRCDIKFDAKGEF